MTHSSSPRAPRQVVAPPGPAPAAGRRYTERPRASEIAPPAREATRVPQLGGLVWIAPKALEVVHWCHMNARFANKEIGGFLRGYWLSNGRCVINDADNATTSNTTSSVRLRVPKQLRLEIGFWHTHTYWPATPASREDKQIGALLARLTGIVSIMLIAGTSDERFDLRAWAVEVGGSTTELSIVESGGDDCPPGDWLDGSPVPIE